MPDEPDRLADDVSAPSAAYLYNLLPDIAKLPANEQFARLHVHFLAALMAYKDGRRGWIPNPSNN